MPVMSVILVIVGCCLAGLLVTALSLKFIVWSLNGLFFGTDPSTGIPALTFLRSVAINFITFGIIAAVGYGVSVWLNWIPRADSFRLAVSIEWYVTLGSYLFSIVMFWKMLPTTLWRAIIIATIDWMMLFLLGGVAFMVMMMIAYSGHSTGR